MIFCTFETKNYLVSFVHIEDGFLLMFLMLIAILIFDLHA